MSPPSHMQSRVLRTLLLFAAVICVQATSCVSGVPPIGERFSLSSCPESLSLPAAAALGAGDSLVRFSDSRVVNISGRKVPVVCPGFTAYRMTRSGTPESSPNVRLRRAAGGCVADVIYPAMGHPRDVQWDKRQGREPRAVYTGQDIMKSLLAATGWQGELQRLSSDTLVFRDTVSVSERQILWCANSSVVGELDRPVNDGGSRR